MRPEPEDDDAALVSAYDMLIRISGPAATADPMSASPLLYGIKLNHEGDFDGARAAFRAAIDAPDFNAETATTVALYLLGLDDKAAAAAACRRALESCADLSAQELSVFQRMLTQAEDTDGLEIVLRRLLDSGDESAAAWAASDLGDLYADRGNVMAARELYQRAMDSGHPNAAPLAAYNLGILMYHQDDLLAAMEATAFALKHAGSHLKPRAMEFFGWLQECNGNWDGGIFWYECAIGTGHEDATPRAQVRLASLLLHKFRDEKEARVLYQRAIDSGHPEMAPVAAKRLARLDGTDD